MIIKNTVIKISKLNFLYFILASKINFRLPNNIVPTVYDLTITPYIGSNAAWDSSKDFTFEGIMNMHLLCYKATKKIVFHSAGLKINEDTLMLSSATDGTITFSKKLEYDNLREFVIVNLDRNCVEGSTYELKMDYTGIIVTELFGFYRSSYLDEFGDRK